MHPDLPPPSPAPPGLTLSELVTAMTRSWRVLGGGALAGAVLGFSVTVAAPATYESVATVRVDPVEPELVTGRPPPAVDMTAEESVAGSRQVAVAASDLLGGTDPDEVVDAVTVTTAPSSAVLRVSFASGSARSAAAGANAVAHAYLAARSVDAMSRRGRLRDRVASELRTADGRVHDDLEAALAQVEIADLRGGDVIDPARVPGRPVGPGALVSGLAGTALGLLVTAPLAARRRPARPGLTRREGAPAS